MNQDGNRNNTIESSIASTTIRRLASVLLGSAVLFSPTIGLAEWDGGIEGGSVISDGGSSTRLRFKLTNLVRPFSQYIYADWLRSDQGENSYEVGYKPHYWFTDNLYLFGEGKFRVDKPLNIDSDLFILGGAGYEFYRAQDRSLWVEAGIGTRTTEFENGSDADDDLGLIRAGFHQVLADLLRFEIDVSSYRGDNRNETTAETGISIRVQGGALKYSYRVRQLNQDGLPDNRKSDSFVSFSYGF